MRRLLISLTAVCRPSETSGGVNRDKNGAIRGPPGPGPGLRGAERGGRGREAAQRDDKCPGRVHRSAPRRVPVREGTAPSREPRGQRRKNRRPMSNARRKRTPFLLPDARVHDLASRAGGRRWRRAGAARMAAPESRIVGGPLQGAAPTDRARPPVFRPPALARR